MYKYVFFDMDGTVLNTIDDIRNAVNYTMRHFGYPEIDMYQAKHYTGRAARHLITMACPEGADIDEVLAFYFEYYEAHCEINTRPYDGVLELMEKLKEAGVKMAVVSNKMDKAVKDLAKTWFDGYLDVAVGEKEGISRKPAPDLVFEAMNQMGADKNSSVYVGDTETDIETAKNAGIPCISVTYGFKTREEIENLGAWRYCDNCDEVYEAIIGQ